MASKGDDAFVPFDKLLNEAGPGSRPWEDGRFSVDLDLLRRLLTLPIEQGQKQESGRPAKALDSWIAHELRRAGFSAHAVWPRARKPRVLPEDLDRLEMRVEALREALSEAEKSSGRIKPPKLRRAITALLNEKIGAHDAYILGDFYPKQIDVGLSSWRRGPDLLISTKTMFSAYGKNLKNRHEEAVGEVSSLRRRHPMAGMGYVYLVHRSIYDDKGAYAILNDILTRLRRPGEAFDATMLLVADWNDSLEHPEVAGIAQPVDSLSADRFFTDLVNSVLDRTPIGQHREARRLRDGVPEGGLPSEEDVVVSSDPEGD